MKKLLLLSLLIFCGISHAQLTSGVLAPARVTNWQNAGVVGGIPSASWPQSGSTIAACGSSGTPVSPATCGITAAITAASNNTCVVLGSGSFYLNAGIAINRSNVCLRGQGANQTILVFSGSGTCPGYGAAGICIASTDTNYKGAVSNGPFTITAANYSQGQTTFTFPNVTHLVIGNPIILDQQDSSTDNGGPFVGQSTATGTFTSPGLAGPYTVSGNASSAAICASSTTYVGCYSLQQIVMVVGCDNVTTVGHACSNASDPVIISPGLNGPEWASGMRAWWATHPPQFDGIENLTIDTSAVTTGGMVNVEIFNAINSWVSGITSLWPVRSHVQLQYAGNITIQNSYFFNTQVQSTSSYGVEHYSSSEALVVNNIFHAVTSPHICDECSGNVFAYNFAVNPFFLTSGYNIPAGGQHAIEDTTLLEGNVMNGMTEDAIHGTGNFDTLFRNYLPGPAPACWSSSSSTSTPQLTYSTASYISCTANRQPINFYAFHRGENSVGNVLGSASSTSYQSCASDLTIYYMGCGNSGVPSDPNVLATSMLWGNVDGFHGFTSPQFNSSEVPTGLSGTQAVFVNSVPASHTLPASFVYPTKPSWWPATKPWPIIGPDVTGGNVSGVNGTVNTNPAEDCYLNVLGGAANGEGPELSFNASSCYAASTTTYSVQISGAVKFSGTIKQ